MVVPFPAFVYNPKENHETIRQKIIGTSTPKKILVSPDSSGHPIMKDIKQILNFKDVIIAEQNILPDKMIIEMAKFLLDKKNTKFWIMPTAAFHYIIRLLAGSKSMDIL
uniref:Uncharacterized protein n=1 Tax=Panagrolaimus sp. PS1159 TaxID=55785 RepID=A0AC35F9J3_9BILA